MSFLGELKRRNVFRVAGVYAVVGWLLVQIAASLEEAVGLPPWFDGFVVSSLAIAFPIALIFAWAFELTPDGLKRTAAVTADESITEQTASKLDMVLVLALFVFATAMLLPRFLPEGVLPGSQNAEQGVHAVADGTAAAGSAVTTPAAAPNAASIAVLPFADLSKAQDQGYFADGISEEILNVLAQVRGMKVAGRTSSFAFKDRNEDLREIGRVLDVAHILEGSVRSEGDKVRVTAQLIQVSDGFHMWSATYDRDLTSIFEVQDDIAQQILVAMKERLMVDEAPKVAAATRTDINAYNLFLEARDLLFSRNEEKMTRALALLDQAIEVDPAYAPAYAARAKAYMLLSDRPSSYGSIPTQEALEQSRANVDKALALDPQLADAFAVQGLNNRERGRLDFAVSSLRRALELNPNSLDARNWLSLSLANDGRFRDVVEQLKTLVDIDPLYRPGVNNLMQYGYEIGDLDAATRAAERYIAITSDPEARANFQSRLALLRNDFAGAIRFAETFGEEASRQAREGLRFQYIDLGVIDPSEGDGALNSVFEPYALADRGETAQAIAKARATIEKSPDYYTGHRVYVEVLSEAREDAQLADYFEREYGGDLERFATRLRVNADPPPYQALAQSMRAMGRQTIFEEAMRRWRFTLDIFRAGGSVTPGRDLEEAGYFAIIGETDRSIALIESAMKKRRLLPLFFFATRSFEENLADDLRFIALRARNLEVVNEERAKLGFDPLTIDYYTRWDGPE
jgi:TolB-like protein/tetratricopeptide (TPR) repeat protein